MLIISVGTGSNQRSGSWHVGETMRIPNGRVLTLQADGHELDAILTILMENKQGVTVEYPADRLTPVL